MRCLSVFLILLAFAPASAFASLIGSKDGRGPITVKGPELHLTDAEITRLRHTTGYVYCPGKTVSGFLVSSDVVVTVAHVFLNDAGAYRQPRSGCYFQNQAAKPVRIPVSTAPGDLRLGTGEPDRITGVSAVPWIGGNHDYAIARLQEPVPAAEPLPFSKNGAEVRSGHSLITVQASQADLKEIFDRRVPLVQACTATRLFPANSQRAGVIYSDCDNTKGGSGGVNLRRIGGELTAVGFFTGSGDDETRRHCTYDEAQECYSHSLLLDGKLLRDLKAMIP